MVKAAEYIIVRSFISMHDFLGMPTHERQSDGWNYLTGHCFTILTRSYTHFIQAYLHTDLVTPHCFFIKPHGPHSYLHLGSKTYAQGRVMIIEEKRTKT